MGVSSEARPAGLRRSLPLATKMVLLSVGLSGALAAGLTWLGYTKAASGLRTKSELALGSESQLTAMMIDNWMAERLVTLRGVASLRSVRTVLETAVSLAREDVDASNLALSDIAAVAPEIESIEVIDLRGNVVASTTDEAQPAGVMKRPEMRSALAGREFVSGISVSPSTGAPCLYTSVPVRGSNATVVGIVRVRESLERVQALVAGVRSRIGEHAQAVLLDRDGLVVAATVDAGWQGRPVSKLDPGRVPEMEAEARWGKAPPPSPLEDAALAAMRGSTARRVLAWTVSGTPQVAVVEPISRAGWTCAAALPLSEIESEARGFLRRALLGAVLGLAGAFFLSRVVARRVVKSIHRLIEVSRKVVDENDLTQQIEVSSNDEVGELARSFSRMVDALRAALSVLQNASGSLLGAAEQLRETTAAEREFLSRQAAALQETQVTAQEIKQTSLLASEKAQTVLKAAEGADEMGRFGEGVVQQSIAGLDAIREQTSAIGEHIQTLSESARQIGQVTSAVKDLADQSNMLALNAAIEAVRSGEHGKGFAVVAREIRALADQSIAATRRVGEILTVVGGSIQTTAKMSEQGVSKVTEGVQRVTQSGETVRGLVSITRQNVDSARQIAAAVAQQGAGIQQIFVAVTDQLQMMEQTQLRLEQTMSAAATVREQAAHVSSLLGRYRL